MIRQQFFALLVLALGTADLEGNVKNLLCQCANPADEFLAAPPDTAKASHFVNTSTWSLANYLAPILGLSALFPRAILFLEMPLNLLRTKTPILLHLRVRMK
jgi:hypothetical protein